MLLRHCDLSHREAPWRNVTGKREATQVWKNSEHKVRQGMKSVYYHIKDGKAPGRTLTTATYVQSKAQRAEGTGSESPRS